MRPYLKSNIGDFCEFASSCKIHKVRMVCVIDEAHGDGNVNSKLWVVVWMMPNITLTISRLIRLNFIKLLVEPNALV